MATILDEWHPADLLIAALRACGIVLLIGGVVLVVLGLLGGSPEPLDETRFNLGLINQGTVYALVGAAVRAASWALRRLLGRR